MFEQSPKKEHSNLSTDKRDLLEFYAESELMAGTLVNNGMALLKEGESLSDELFVSKYVLSEQAYRFFAFLFFYLIITNNVRF
jgi:hypothetical protein